MSNDFYYLGYASETAKLSVYNESRVAVWDEYVIKLFYRQLLSVYLRDS